MTSQFPPLTALGTTQPRTRERCYLLRISADHEQQNVLACLGKYKLRSIWTGYPRTNTTHARQGFGIHTLKAHRHLQLLLLLVPSRRDPTSTPSKQYTLHSSLTLYSLVPNPQNTSCKAQHRSNTSRFFQHPPYRSTKHIESTRRCRISITISQRKSD